MWNVLHISGSPASIWEARKLGAADGLDIASRGSSNMWGLINIPSPQMTMGICGKYHICGFLQWSSHVKHLWINSHVHIAAIHEVLRVECGWRTYDFLRVNRLSQSSSANLLRGLVFHQRVSTCNKCPGGGEILSRCVWEAKASAV